MSISSTLRGAFLFGLTLAGSQLLAGCDNITCVFTTGCRDDGDDGPTGENPASIPDNGLLILLGAPVVEAVFPDVGADVGGDTPVVIVFSESMNALTLLGAFEVISLGGMNPGTPVPGVAQTLVGDGRVLLLLPPPGLDSGDYAVQVAMGALVTDLTGQALDVVAGQELGSFTVADMPPAAPQVIATYPADTAANQSDTTEIVAVFDRFINPSDVTTDSFEVRIAGNPPVDNPPPEPVTFVFMGIPDIDTRAFTYRSADPTGKFTSLGSDVQVDVRLSPPGAQIFALPPGPPVVTHSFFFRSTPFRTPLDAGFLSQPCDAIGLSNLTAGNPEELLIQVDLFDGAPGDLVDLFLVGVDKDDPLMQLIAFDSTVTLQGTAPIMTASFMLANVNILASPSPTDTRFLDGPVSFAFSLRRGTAVSPVHVLDVDPITPDIQDPILDTVAPVIEDLLVPGNTTGMFYTDQRDVVVTGRAGHAGMGNPVPPEIRSVEVALTGGMLTNGMTPPAVGSIGGVFVAAPVALTDGILAGGTTDYTVVAYDEALNASPAVTGTVRQLGAVTGAPFSPGSSVLVEAFDAATLAPLAGAFVIVHSDAGDMINFPFWTVGQTVADGTITVTTDATAAGAIVSVAMPGYDLFTFHGVASTRLSVPLWPTVLPPLTTSGSVISSDPSATNFVPGLDSKLDDSRRPFESARTFEPNSCSGGTSLSCPFGPETIRAGMLGVQSFLAGDFMLDMLTFNPVQLLRAFCLSVPVLAGPFPAVIDLPFLLDDPSAPASEVPMELTAVTLRGDLTAGIDLLNLVGDPLTTGQPRVTVETIVPGAPGSIVVGLGLAFDQGGGLWNVRSAFPGAVSPAGFFGMKGTVDTDLFLRAELRDTAGNVVGARPRESTFGSLPCPNTLFANNVARLVSPPDMGNTGGQSWSLTFENAIPDPAGQPGLYRVQLTDSTGRGWTLWRVDPSGVADVLVRVPDIAAGGGVPLMDGALTLVIGAFAWPTLDLDSFLWSDVEREHDLFSLSRSYTLTQP